jgi:hypothetical protein
MLKSQYWENMDFQFIGNVGTTPTECKGVFQGVSMTPKSIARARHTLPLQAATPKTALWPFLFRDGRSQGERTATVLLPPWISHAVFLS